MNLYRIVLLIPTLSLISCQNISYRNYKVGDRIVTRADKNNNGNETYVYPSNSPIRDIPPSYFVAKHFPMRDGFDALLGFEGDTMVLVEASSKFRIKGTNKFLRIKTVDNLSFAAIQTDNGEYKGYIKISDKD